MKEMGIKIGLAVVLTLSLILGMGMPAAQASVDNRVQANLDTTYWHVVDADSIDNVSLPGTNKSTATLLVNTPDSGASVTTPKVTYSPAAGLSVGFLFPQYLVPGGPPYVWQFPDIAENGLFISLAGGITGAPFNYEPGFAASRSFSQTEFTGPGTQVIEIYATPEEPMDQLTFRVQVINDAQLNAIITDATGDGTALIFPGGKFMNAVVSPVTVGTTYHMEVTLSIAPSPGVITATYKPGVTLIAGHHTASGSEGAAIIQKMLELGEWTVETPEEYTWNWQEIQNYAVTFSEVNLVESYNLVYLNIGTNYDYRPGSDVIPNITTQSSAWINSNLHNGTDNTHGNVIGPVLDLTAVGTVTGVNPQDYLVPGSTYTWAFPDIPEEKNFYAGVGISGPVEFSTGFSMSRSMDQTVFPAAGGTQTLTISITPEEPVDVLQFHGNADVGAFQGIATVTSGSGPNIYIPPDGRSFHTRIDTPVIGNTYEWQVIIEIGPLPEGIAGIEYKPWLYVQNTDIIDSGIFIGNSMSGEAWSLGGSTPLGTFTWQTIGNYSWRWEETINKQVGWDGTARYIYPPPGQEAINQAIDEGIAWVRTQQDPATGAWFWGRPPRPGQTEEPEVPNVGMTGFAVWSMLHGLIPQTDPQIQAGIQYILSQQDLNPTSNDYGSFGQRGRTYETGLAILALRATNNPAYLDEMALAVQYLMESQNDENKTYPGYPGPFTSADWAYGGWDYSYNSVFTSIWTPGGPVPVDPYVRADMSNSQFAIIGLKAAQEGGIEIDPAVWAKAQIFIDRCHMTDGGFGYQPAVMGSSSMGTITAGCVWSLRLMDVPMEDPLVQSGLDWLDSHPFDGNNPAGAYRNWFLWSAAKAFTLCGRSPVLEQGTWYSDYARYLIDNQEEDGKWVNPNWPDGESNLNATTCGLLVLEKAVLPPPPGLDFVTVDRMRVEFDTRPNRDKIKIFEASFQLDPEASYDLAADDVTVAVDGVTIFIPAGSFIQQGNKERYKFSSTGGAQPRIQMELNFDRGEWDLMVHDIDASAITSDDGVDVTLMIGYMLAGQNVPMWIDYLEYPPQP